VVGQHHAPAALPPGKTRYPLYRRLGGPQGPTGRVRKISPPAGIRSPDCPARSESLYLLSYTAHSDEGPYFNFMCMTPCTLVRGSNRWLENIALMDPSRCVPEITKITND
jgi:hypothetical protein